MAKQTLSYKPKGFGSEFANFANGDGTTAKTITTAATDDSILKGLVITSTDTSPRAVSIIVSDGATDYVVDTLAVPAGAGTDGSTPAVNALAGDWLPVDSNGKKILPLAGGTTLKAAMLAAVTAAKTVTVAASLENF